MGSIRRNLRDHHVAELPRRMSSMETQSSLGDSSITQGGLRVASEEGLLVEGSQSITGTSYVYGTQNVSGTINIDGLQTVSGTSIISGTQRITGDLIGEVSEGGTHSAVLDWRGEAVIQGGFHTKGQVVLEGEDIYLMGLAEGSDAPKVLGLVPFEGGGGYRVEAVPAAIGGGGDPGPGPIAGAFMWPFPESSVTSEYGPRPGIGKGYHDGIDFGQATGAPIPAVGAGTVTDVWIHSDAGPYAIDIDHGGGFHSQYWHNSAKYVSAGQQVAMGDIIGAVGNLGLSYGAHLHLEIIGPGSPSGRYSWPWRDFYATYGATGVGG